MRCICIPPHEDTFASCQCQREWGIGVFVFCVFVSFAVEGVRDVWCMVGWVNGGWDLGVMLDRTQYYSRFHDYV